MLESMIAYLEDGDASGCLNQSSMGEDEVCDVLCCCRAYVSGRVGIKKRRGSVGTTETVNAGFRHRHVTGPGLHFQPPMRMTGH